MLRFRKVGFQTYLKGGKYRKYRLVKGDNLRK